MKKYLIPFLWFLLVWGLVLGWYSWQWFLRTSQYNQWAPIALPETQICAGYGGMDGPNGMDSACTWAQEVASLDDYGVYLNRDITAAEVDQVPVDTGDYVLVRQSGTNLVVRVPIIDLISSWTILPVDGSKRDINASNTLTPKTTLLPWELSFQVWQSATCTWTDNVCMWLSTSTSWTTLFNIWEMSSLEWSFLYSFWKELQMFWMNNFWIWYRNEVWFRTWANPSNLYVFGWNNHLDWLGVLVAWSNNIIDAGDSTVSAQDTIIWNNNIVDANNSLVLANWQDVKEWSSNVYTIWYNSVLSWTDLFDFWRSNTIKWISNYCFWHSCLTNTTSEYTRNIWYANTMNWDTSFTVWEANVINSTVEDWYSFGNSTQVVSDRWFVIWFNSDVWNNSEWCMVFAQDSECQTPYAIIAWWHLNTDPWETTGKVVLGKYNENLTDSMLEVWISNWAWWEGNWLVVRWSGWVQVGPSTVTCAWNKVGTIKFSGDNFFGCTATTWWMQLN